MKYFWRLLRVWMQARLAPQRNVRDVSRIRLRVQPVDLDTNLHMNNGTYLTLQDLGRFDWMLRTGVWKTIRALGWAPVVSRQTITYRKSLAPRDRFELNTRYLGMDDRNFYLEHRFVCNGEIYAQSYVIGRFVHVKGGAVSHEEALASAPEVGYTANVPDWVREWAAASRLPSTRADAPNIHHRILD